MSESLERSVAEVDPLSFEIPNSGSHSTDGKTLLTSSPNVRPDLRRQEALFNPFASPRERKFYTPNSTTQNRIESTGERLTHLGVSKSQPNSSNSVANGEKLSLYQASKEPKILLGTCSELTDLKEKNASHLKGAKTSAKDLENVRTDKEKKEPKASVRKDALPFRLEYGETLQLRLSKVIYLSHSRDTRVGTLILTNYRLVFTPETVQTSGSNHVLHWQHTDDALFHLNIGSISKISRVSGQVGGGRGKESLYLSVTCKDFRVLSFKFESSYQVTKVLGLARHLVFPVTVNSRPGKRFDADMVEDDNKGIEWLFAFSHKDKRGEYSTPKGWNIYSIEEELGRIGVLRSTNWRLSSINSNFEFCESYPKKIVVPARIPDKLLYDVAKFRSRARIPIMSWLHSSNGGSIWRCSQPKVGMGNNFCLADEELVASIRSCTPCNHVKIIDARPFKNAMTNRVVRGMGYEDESRYPGTSISFQNIENIHAVRSALEKLFKLSQSTSSSSSNYLSSIENTGWLNHIRSILVGAVKMASFVSRKGLAVLVHCSDGWDRTSQLVSLSLILLDPYYRTIHGFEVLIEKEWVSCGFQFQKRTGHGVDASKDLEPNNRSPVFLQFIDCVWQLLRIFPGYFEFNQGLLLCILEHLYSCRFGTFLYDNDRERYRKHVADLTVSVWEFINTKENIEAFRNPFYLALSECQTKGKQEIIPRPSVIAKQVVLWEDYFMKYSAQPSILDHGFVNTGANAILNNIDFMRTCMVKAQERIKELEAQLEKTQE